MHQADVMITVFGHRLWIMDELAFCDVGGGAADAVSSANKLEEQHRVTRSTLQQRFLRQRPMLGQDGQGQPETNADATSRGNVG